MEIPFQELPPDTLRAVVEEFVTREGTDYGDESFSLDEKVTHVLAQLRQGNVVIVFDQESETCNIVARGVPGGHPGR